MKKIALLCFFTILLVNESWSFDWSLGFLSNNLEANDSPFSRPLQLQNGNEFTFYVKSEAQAYCYIIARDSENLSFVLINSVVQKDQMLIIGPLEVTPPEGQELFYVIMSDTPQKTLEDRIHTFEANDGLQKASDDLLNEVLKIRRDISQLRERPEMPVFMGGSFRNDEPEPKGTRYSGTECYVKSIIIRH
jgi:hypothetical protein